MSKPIESLASGTGADAIAFREAIRAVVMDIVDDLHRNTSTGVAMAGKVPVLDAAGRLHPTLLAPDGYQRANRIVVSSGADLGNLGNYSGTLIDSALRVHGTDVLGSVGVEKVIWGNHGGMVSDLVAKSRGANVGEFSSCLIGDRVYRKFIQAAGLGGQFGHVGVETWQVDGTPTNAGELHGKWKLAIGSGLHVSEASVGMPHYFGSFLAIEANSKQQVHFPGRWATVLTVAGEDFGGILRIGPGNSAPGFGAVKFDLGLGLLTVPEAGVLERGPDGWLFFTHAAAKRGRILLGQQKLAGDAGAVAAGAGAGAGAAIAVVWGHGCARVTLTTGAAPATGEMFTLTFPQAFATRSFSFVQAANDFAAHYTGRNWGTNDQPGSVTVLVKADGVAPAATTTYVVNLFFQGD